MLSCHFPLLHFLTHLPYKRAWINSPLPCPATALPHLQRISTYFHLLFCLFSYFCILFCFFAYYIPWGFPLVRWKLNVSLNFLPSHAFRQKISGSNAYSLSASKFEIRFWTIRPSSLLSAKAITDLSESLKCGDLNPETPQGTIQRNRSSGHYNKLYAKDRLLSFPLSAGLRIPFPQVTNSR